MTFAIPRPIASPCIGVCTLDAQSYCIGCWRTGAEIAGWIGYTDAERARLIDVVLPAREASRDGG